MEEDIKIEDLKEGEEVIEVIEAEHKYELLNIEGMKHFSNLIKEGMFSVYKTSKLRNVFEFLPSKKYIKLFEYFQKLDNSVLNEKDKKVIEDFLSVNSADPTQVLKIKRKLK